MPCYGRQGAATLKSGCCRNGFPGTASYWNGKALTGGMSWSAVPTSPGGALIHATACAGNCELAVLAPAQESLMPKGTVIVRDELSGRRTVAPTAPRPRLLLGGGC